MRAWLMIIPVGYWSGCLHDGSSAGTIYFWSNSAAIVVPQSVAGCNFALPQQTKQATANALKSHADADTCLARQDPAPHSNQRSQPLRPSQQVNCVVRKAVAASGCDALRFCSGCRCNAHEIARRCRVPHARSLLPSSRNSS